MRPTTLLLPLALAVSTPVAAAEIVPVPEFRSVQLRGGGHVTIRQGPVQRVTIVEGSTQFTRVRVTDRGELKIDACNERCPQRYNLRVEIHSPRVPDAAISGGGLIAFSPGFAPESNFSVAVNGGGQIDARSLRTTNVSAAVNGGGRVLTGHSEQLSAAVSGGGEIRYAGNPQVSKAVHGGGAVHRGD